ncbi:hypothetical protein KV112_21890 [Mycolicibacter sp. MYC123]|uniref:PknH-like extracellular domain-containing protein n=1 Tax=[Mycobacterium] zoologicum TaxID=2872311 RepID=A0ABU5YQK9_9MYCO|nr:MULTISPECIES: hypothetical protein [unclassified Mycolicibacter]MEB3052348.1 hypothetical protein [Mycolicibacter sp. MYC123]MEB3062227.1 hypothetical protein [Mycolicibacter sp. MYC101]
MEDLPGPRQASMVTENRSADATGKRLVILGTVGAVVLIALAGGVAMFLHGRGTTASHSVGPVDQWTEVSKTLPSTPVTPPIGARTRVIVNVDGAASHMNVTSIEKWASDVNKHDEETLVQKCWTYPRSYIRDRYLADAARVADLMGRSPQMTQSGPMWTTGQSGDSSLVAWAEAKSDYACPEIVFAEDSRIRDDVILYRARRYILREQNNPVNRNDTAGNYPLVCEFVPGSVSNIHRANPDDMAMVSSNSSGWVVRAGNVELTMHQEPGITCIESAR